MHWYLAAIANYGVFDGRARRREFWTYVLVNCAVFVAVSLGSTSLDLLKDTLLNTAISSAYGLFTLATALPSLALAIRRLHDVGQSGWSLFAILVPMAGPIWLLFTFLRDSQPGDNSFGASPKAPAVQHPLSPPAV